MFDRAAGDAGDDPREHQPGPAGGQHDEDDDRAETSEALPDFAEVGLEQNRAHDLLFQLHRPEYRQRAAPEIHERRRIAHVDRRRRTAGRLGGPRIYRHRCASPVEEPRRHDVVARRKGTQGFGGRLRIVEHQRRGAVGADDVGETGDVAHESRSRRGVVVNDEHRAGEGQNHPPGQHHRDGQLARQGLMFQPAGQREASAARPVPTRTHVDPGRSVRVRAGGN